MVCNPQQAEHLETLMNYLTVNDIDIYQTIEAALRTKRNAIEYKKKIQEPFFQRMYSAEDLFKIVIGYDGANTYKRVQLYSDNEDIEPEVAKSYEVIVKDLCLYFANDERFERNKEQNNYSLKKGICLFGNIGSGKTHLMKAFNNNPRRGYVVKTVKGIVSEYREKENQKKVLDNYTNITYKGGHNILTGKNDRTFCFDDLGREENANVFGNLENVMEEILDIAYERRLVVHMTTNLDSKQILERYGKRFLDRMRQMMNFIEFHPDTKSRRAGMDYE